ncbi:hypothetical protein F5888DRAFT_1638196 [Russula emetica]|nr:hypothetical protein F5888DRAFT_1638196 [Russula emetica]
MHCAPILAAGLDNRLVLSHDLTDCSMGEYAATSSRSSRLSATCCRIFLIASAREYSASRHIAARCSRTDSISHFKYRLGGGDEQGCDAFVEIGAQGAERWSILEDKRGFFNLRGTGKPRNSGGELHQFALFIHLIERAVRGSGIQLAVCPRGCDVGSFAKVSFQEMYQVGAEKGRVWTVVEYDRYHRDGGVHEGADDSGRVTYATGTKKGYDEAEKPERVYPDGRAVDHELAMWRGPW